ncbi:MAG: hypothetical protein HFJ09_07050 [Lachnospiraceae bacterium]|nr:hypothetical protein [Lachnospiraceae bacterium]
MFTCKLLSTGLTRQTPTRSRFACKYAGLEVFVGLRELHSNVAIRSISWGQNTFCPQHIAFKERIICEKKISINKRKLVFFQMAKKVS